MPITINPQADQKNKKSEEVGKVGQGSVNKELESQRSEEKRLLDEVVEANERSDFEAEKRLQESLGKEARLSQPHAKIPDEVAESGVVSPQVEASKVADGGSTIDLPITEAEFEAGKKTKVGGNVSNKEVFGVPSIAAFVMFIGRVIKLAHKYARLVSFRKVEGK